MTEEDNQTSDSVPESFWERWWVLPTASTLGALFLMIALLIGYHHLFAPRPVKFVVLDLHKIIEAKELKFTSILTKQGATDEDRKDALALVASIEPELQKTLIRVRQECDCEILVKAAALTSDTIPDITPRVAELMGVTDVEVEKSREIIRSSVPTSPSK